MRGVAPKRIKIPRTGSPPSAERPRAQEKAPPERRTGRAHIPHKRRRARGETIPPRALPASAAARAHRKAPSASATPCPPAALRCSTLGEGGLNCRVRDGTG